MVEYPVLTKDDLAAFTSRPVEAFSNAPLVSTAIAQATLLFKIGTCLSTLDDDPTTLELAKFAILAYADYIILSAPYAAATASPFSSETLGSYSYSKSATAVTRGEKTGIMWFDLAVARLGVCGLNDSSWSHGGVEVFEHDAPLVAAAEGNLRMLTPFEVEQHRRWAHDPASLFRGV